MQTEKWGLTGGPFIFATYIVGTLIVAYGVWKGTELNNNKQRIDDEQLIGDLNVTITNLRDTISELDEENKLKQDSIQKMAFEILDFNTKIESNTSATQKLVKEIEVLSTITRTVAEQIKQEQNQKGRFNLIVPNSQGYSIPIGGSIWSYGREELEIGFYPELFGYGSLPIFIKIKNDELLISTSLYDIDGNLVVQIIENEWALNKGRNFSINYDDKALEIVDSKGRIILQIIVDGMIFNFNMLAFDSYNCTLINDSGIRIRPIDDKDLEKEIYLYNRNIRPLFKHIGENYLGKRIVW